MNAMTANQTRRRFLDYFVRMGHTEVPSGSLVPGNDPTLLFTNAGMVPFKDTFLGLESRPYVRATTAQKVLRVSGKHNDLEEVGVSPRHHTFFEMLGNFSFGDYFKRDAIRYAWQLLTEEFGLPIERLWFTVFAGDDEVPADDDAARLWVETGAPPDRVLRFGRKDNFWLMGDTGPCGPCSEITIYIGDDLDKMRAEGVNSEDPDYVEIWNLVFMQFDKATMRPLPRPSIDTGMGFERICMVLQGVHSSYEADLFLPIIERTLALTGGDEAHYRAHQVAYRAVADHTRACVFLIADGILPGNGNRSYVLRRILRRAAYQGRTIGLTKPFLAQTAEVVIEMMGDAYPELRRRRDFILQSLTDEEERFGRTISSGLTLLDQELVGIAPDAPLPGKVAFTLYDTFGFPRDLTERIAAERGHPVDIAGYDSEMDAQRARGRAGAQFKRGSEADLWTGQDLPATDFTGYTALAGEGSVLALIVEGDEAGEGHAGQSIRLVLDRTPFYAQGGGQVGDTGTLSGPNGQIRVTDTQRPIPGLIVHFGIIEEGMIAIGDHLDAAVDAERRQDIQRNHTATHLLHRVAREVLGDHAAQAGSLVAPDRLRFDFTHGRAIAPEQLREMEHRVNEWIRADTPVAWIVTDYQDAIERGAMALFGEKYGDRVRMVTAGCDQAGFCSRELCGGTHVARTGEIGFFRVLQESSSAGGIRRIEAVTGRGAEEWALGQAGMVREAASRLGAPPAQILERIDGLLAEVRQQRQQIEQLRATSGQGAREALLEQVQSMGDLRYLAAHVAATDSKELDELGDWLRDKLGSAVIVLGAVLGEKPQLLALVTADLVARGYHAGNLVKRLAPIVGGGGGGRPDRASAGGRDSTKLDEALAQVPSFLQEMGQAVNGSCREKGRASG
ncbi:MAG TPA: alanine--tRNA ligase [Chloroflexota bacterium]|nr:alanine--tRNA ligase [Chloroflexota bacterium]